MLPISRDIDCWLKHSPPAKKTLPVCLLDFPICKNNF